MARHEGFVLQATYRIHHGVPVVYVFGRLTNGETFLIREHRERPHFYIPSVSAEQLQGLDARAIDSECVNFAGESVTRVDVRIPADAPGVRDKLHALGTPTYEADVRFAMRYLIDRDIKGGIAISGEVQPGTGTRWLFVDPHTEPCGARMCPTVLSFDIETNPHTDKLLAIACYGAGVDEVVVVDGQLRDMPQHAVAVPTEKDALHYFAELVRRLDVDVLTGWNVIDFDLTFLAKVAKRVRYDLQLGRASGRMNIRSAQGYFGSGQVTIPGRLVLDGMDLVRGAFVRLEDYSLESAAQAVLGEGKTFKTAGQDKVAQILRTYNEELEAFCEYARTDARLALDIVQALNLIDLAFARSALTGMPADRVAASIASFDFVYLSALNKLKVVAPSVAQPGATQRIPQGGGAVFEPEVGLHKQVWVFDYKSLYPSIMRTFFVDPLGNALAERYPSATTQDGTRFARPSEQLGVPSILPRLLDELFEAREAAKARNDEVASQAIKILMNSFYGVLGTPACRFFNPHIANAITGQGRYFLHWSKQWFEARGYRVLYGDTDSVFVASGQGTADAADALGHDLAQAFNAELAAHITERFDVTSKLELEYEKLYTHLFLARTRGGAQGARKRYAGIRYGKDAPEFVGMEVVRRDWTELAKDVQRNLFGYLFADKPDLRLEIAEYLRDVVASVRSDPDKSRLVYRKGLRKTVDSYQTNVPPHVQAVKRSQQSAPRIVHYVITRDGPYLADEVPDHVSLDLEHYIQKQVKPVALPVLDALGMEFAQVIGDDKQIDLF